MRSGSQTFTGGKRPRGMSQVEYRLARDAVVREYRRGRLSKLDVCDAHPELMRVAKNHGDETDTDCPICEQAKLVHVSFAFGPRLPPSGYPLSTVTEIGRFVRNREVSCYVIEVCTECSWNHLLRQLTTEGLRRRIPS